MSHTVPDPRVSWAPLLPDNIKNPFGQHITVEERDVEVAADLVVLAVGRTTRCTTIAFPDRRHRK